MTDVTYLWCVVACYNSMNYPRSHMHVYGYETNSALIGTVGGCMGWDHRMKASLHETSCQPHLELLERLSLYTCAGLYSKLLFEV